jgi:hypothetical protein
MFMAVSGWKRRDILSRHGTGFRATAFSIGPAPWHNATAAAVEQSAAGQQEGDIERTL